MLWTIIASILSALGFVFKNEYLYIGCGLIAFMSFLFYINRDFAMDNETEYADLREDYPLNCEEIIRKEKQINFARRIAILVLITGIYSWLFSWHFITLTGILYGFYRMPGFVKMCLTPKINV